jgi:hypothetical protein
MGVGGGVRFLRDPHNRPSSLPQRPFHLTFTWLSSHLQTKIAKCGGAGSCMKCSSAYCRTEDRLSTWRLASVLKWPTPFFVYLLTLKYQYNRTQKKFPVRTRFFAHVQIGPGAHPTSCTIGTGSFPAVKRPGRGADHPPPPSAEVENEQSYTSTPHLGSWWPVIGRPLPFISKKMQLYLGFCFKNSTCWIYLYILKHDARNHEPKI